MVDEQPSATPVPEGRFAGREAFAQLVRDGLALASQQGWREMVFCDPNFEDWPLHERQTLELLNAWARTGRHFRMYANQYDSVVRYQARFANWRRTWGHIIDCRVCRQIDTVNFPSLLWSPQWAMQRLDPVRCSGVSGSEPERLVQVRELLDALHQASIPGFPATTLGL
jgi:hypothetical protein